MKYAYDLHIHTALSPCADDDMTPNNIVNMSILKQLDIIAITDHNSAENLSAVCKCAEGKRIVVVPGMEIETSEEVHLLCYFPDVDSALKVQRIVYKALPGIDIREDIFGRQLIFDEDDEIKGKIKQMLVTATALSVEDVFSIAKAVGGVVVPAHVDRDSYSIISNLGSMPVSLDINHVEISRECNSQEFIAKHKQLVKYKQLCSSDAHHLGDILESESYIELENLNIKGILACIK